MKSILALLALVALAFAAPAPLLFTDSPTAIEGSYIVVFKAAVSPVARDAHFRRVRGLPGVEVSEEARFAIGSFAGYSGAMSNSSLGYVLAQPEVDYVEANQVVQLSACAQQTAVKSWGLTRVAEEQLNLNGLYNYASTAGEGVDAYVVDTGIYTQHTDFGGRAVWGANYADTQNTDCNGHGTHVAGTVGGTAYGVAKKVTLIAVKVLTCSGSGTNAGVISGINYVAAQYLARKKPSVANMSLGGGKSTALNAAVAAAVNSGVAFAVAAGNDNQDACNYSPASEALAITVGATTQTDTRASFSNFGSCVDIFAPGYQITAPWIGSTTAVSTISGTSMASPHVAGAVALLLGADSSLTPAKISTILTSDAGVGYLNLACSGNTNCLASPNDLLHTVC